MVGKIGAVSKRTPVKPAAKRVAKPVAKSAVKRVANGAKPGAKPGAKRVAKPVAKRAGVKRATPKAKKVNFNKLLIIIRNVANRTHKKGRMTGGALEDAKNTILKYLISSDLTTAIIGLINNDDSNPAGLTTTTPEDNLILRVGAGIKKVGTGGTMVELLTAIDKLLTVMKSITAALAPANGNLATNIHLNNIAHIIAEENIANFAELTTINSSTATFTVANPATTPLEAAVKAATAAGNTAVEMSNTPMAVNPPAAPLDKLDTNFDVFNTSPSLAISSITTNAIDVNYTSLITALVSLEYKPIYDYILTSGSAGVPAIDAGVKKHFAMLMIAITLAKIHKIIEGIL